MEAEQARLELAEQVLPCPQSPLLQVEHDSPLPPRLLFEMKGPYPIQNKKDKQICISVTSTLTNAMHGMDSI